MPPKKKDVKSEKGQQKAEVKAKQKVAEDKTFGLKNKNKSRAVQKYIKGVTTAAQPQLKGGDSALVGKQTVEKEEKKKTAQQEALLASLFKGTENIKKAALEEVKVYDPKTSREDQKINLYEDQRNQKENNANWDRNKLEEVIAAKHSEANANATDIVCKYFIDSVENKQYGWFWICPNGGDACKYRHCLPPGYVLKTTVDDSDFEEEPEPLEDKIERERLALPAGGTPVTLETFKAWKERKEKARLLAVEQERQTEAKKTGGKGLHVLSGKDLFTYDPSLFVDDEGAADEDDYAEDEDWDARVAENENMLKLEAERLAQEDEKRQDVSVINESLFLHHDEDSLPEDLDELDG